MRPALRPTLVLLAVALATAGCSDGGKAPAANGSDGFDDLGVKATGSTGVLLGVVVDEAIRPLADAKVALLLPTGEVEQTTDDTGRFAFGDLEPGTYLLRATHLLHKEAQTSAEVFAGVEDPKVQRILLERLFSQEPFVEPYKFEGYIQCGYSISGVMSSLCLNDYTHFVGPYTCPECEYILDNRGTTFGLGAGWQTLVFEMTWDPTTQATSEEMRLTISHFPRPASHWYCGGLGSDPVLVRMEINVTCEDQQDEPENIPAEGLPNLHIFAATATSDQPASATFGQQFVVYSHFFYYGSPPEGWSFLAGEEPPF